MKMIYRSCDLKEVLERSEYRLKKNRKISIKKSYVVEEVDGKKEVVEIPVYYLDIPMAFDIEDSHWYVEKTKDGKEIQRTCQEANKLLDTGKLEDKKRVDSWEKRSCMYHWQFAIGEYVFFGRTWVEFVDFISELEQFFGCTLDTERLVIYVHNLSHEFSFMSNWFNWDKVFALNKRKPVQALKSNSGVEFRCSYALTGKSLEAVGEEVGVKKLKGDLDYSKIRHSKTPMKPKELDYCANDVLILTKLIKEKIKQDGGIAKIPLTKTGYVRNHCRKEVLKNKDNRTWLKGMTLKEDEYAMWKSAFQGGFTHANSRHIGKHHISCLETEVFKGGTPHKCNGRIGSFDIGSSYPSSIVSGEFPVSKGRKVNKPTKKQFVYYLKTHCCLFDVKIKGLKAKDVPDHFLSISKCYDYDAENIIVDNGRVVCCNELCTTVTHLDWFILSKTYDMESFEINSMYVYRKGRLPKELVKTVLDYYGMKTELKGVAGKDTEYMLGKERVNSIYGMMVMDVVRDEEVFDNEYGTGWRSYTPDLQTALEKENKNKKRFLFYGWGVFVAAISRYRLQSMILKIDNEDYLYSDTDSIKMLNYDKYQNLFKEFNDNIDRAMKQACEDFGFDYSITRPKTIKGEEKPLGHFEFDGEYLQFSTLGAKRYMTKTTDGKIEITIAGVNKKVGVNYFLDNAAANKTSPLAEFKDGVKIGTEYSGKLLMSYVDDELRCKVTDYMGVESDVIERTYVHASGTSYSLSVSLEFETYLKSIGINIK